MEAGWDAKEVENVQWWNIKHPYTIRWNCKLVINVKKDRVGEEGGGGVVGRKEDKVKIEEVLLMKV